MRLFAATLFLLFFHILLLGQSGAELFLNNNKLRGSCDNAVFTDFEIELDKTYERIDSVTLFNQLPRVGTLNFRNKSIIPTEFTLTERAGYSQILFRFKSNWYSFDKLKFKNKSIVFSIDIDPIVPPTIADLEIVRLAKSILSEEQYWNANDDRDCSDDIANKSFSLYCALRIASLEVENKYNHRNAALQKLRHVIRDKYPERQWNHRLMDFNNMEETTFKDIIETLNKIELQFEKEIARRN